jgi:hypothetical protein
MSQVLETIRETILKIKALHDGATTDGEREAAESRLNALLDKHDLSLADLIEPKKYDHEFRHYSELQKRLLRQIVAHVTGELRPVPYYYGSRKPSTRSWFELTPAQAIDVDILYEYYWQAFEEEADDFLTAFVHKHNLGVEVDDEERPEMTPEDVEHWLKLRQLQQAMQDLPSPLAHGYLEEGK